MSKAAPAAAKDEKKPGTLAPPAPKKGESSASSEASSDEETDSSDEDSDDEMTRLEKLNLSKDQIILLKNAFTAFDKDKKGCLGLDMIGTILELLGHAQTQAELQQIIKEVDTDGSGELEFEEFCNLASKFLVEEEDESQVNAELLHWELKEAFRLYDKKGLGYITTADFKEILKELDPDIAEKDLIGIVNEVDDDDSGTVDFEEFYKALR